MIALALANWDGDRRLRLRLRGVLHADLSPKPIPPLAAARHLSHFCHWAFAVAISGKPHGRGNDLLLLADAIASI
jgi:hypothetical protein